MWSFTVTEFDLSSYADLDPAQFAALVKSAPREQLDEVLAGPQRATVLNAIFDRMPTLFRPDKARDTSTVIRWVITGASENTYEVVIADGTCHVAQDPSLTPKVTLTMDGYTFLQLVSGNANPAMLAMTGKVRIGGDMLAAASIANLFDLPKA